VALCRELGLDIKNHSTEFDLNQQLRQAKEAKVPQAKIREIDLNMTALSWMDDFSSDDRLTILILTNLAKDGLPIDMASTLV